MVRLLEQHENLKEYFLTYLPTTAGFKYNVEKTDRYKQICDHLQSELTLPYLAFVAFAHAFEVFLVKFQSMRPRIHLLYSALEHLLWTLLSKFMKSKYIYDEVDGLQVRKSANEMLSLKFNDKKVLPLHKIDIGTKVKSCLSSTTFCEELCNEGKKFCENCLACFQQSISHFKKLPFNSIIKQCSFLNPLKRNDLEALSSISNLSLSICKALKDVLPDIFKVSATEEEICDHIRNEFRLLQMEEIPESFYKKNIVQCPKRKQPSYWEKAFELLKYQMLFQMMMIMLI